MGDMGDFFRDWKAFKAVQKKDRHEAAKALFDAATQPMPGWTKHTEWHWSRDLAGSRMDYWPSTGKWKWRGRYFHGTPYNTARFIAKREAD